MNFDKALIISLISFLCFTTECFGQNCCDEDEKLVICYLPSDEYCTGDCRYNYDASFMEGLRLKLNNSDNFGLNGISPCEIEEVALRDINNAGQLISLNCDIIFMGVTSPQLSADNAIFTTTLPPSFTDAVKEWSVECIENLVVAFQGESTRWGYEIENDNVNPNTPGMISTPNIFNGVFGMVAQVFQGGTFQANFSVIPSTGATILAEDDLGRPTILLDEATNDILMADVGLVCNGAGDVTVSPMVFNNNDILVCNIFALGCEIAGNVTEQSAIICENEDYVLPDGLIVNQEGDYSSTIMNSLGCDSTIVTSIELSIPPSTEITYDGCADDGYEIEIGSGIYNESNPVGTEILSSFYGCDSLVSIELVFKENSQSTLDTVICADDSFQYLGESFSGEVDTVLIIPNAVNCDSFVNVIVEVFDFSDVDIDLTPLEVFNAGAVTFNNLVPSSYDIVWIQSSGLSCADCASPTLNNIENIPVYNLSITSEEGCVKEYDIEVFYNCDPYIPNIFNPESISGNDQFGPLVPCTILDYDFILYDRWGSVVFQTNDQEVFWDGRLNKKDVQPGVFVYQIKYSNKGIPVLKTGQLTLVR